MLWSSTLYTKLDYVGIMYVLFIFTHAKAISISMIIEPFHSSASQGIIHCWGLLYRSIYQPTIGHQVVHVTIIMHLSALSGKACNTKPPLLVNIPSVIQSVYADARSVLEGKLLWFFCMILWKTIGEDSNRSKWRSHLQWARIGLK